MEYHEGLIFITKFEKTFNRVKGNHLPVPVENFLVFCLKMGSKKSPKGLEFPHLVENFD